MGRNGVRRRVRIGDAVHEKCRIGRMNGSVSVTEKGIELVRTRVIGNLRLIFRPENKNTVSEEDFAIGRHCFAEVFLNFVMSTVLICSVFAGSLLGRLLLYLW